MSEKRRPTVKIVAEIKGKRIHVELFAGHLWKNLIAGNGKGSQWRVRINGKWQQGDHTFTMSDVVRQLRGWMARRLSR